MTKALDDLFKDRPETLDPQDVADMLGKSKQAIYKWLKDGTIRGYKIGTSWIIIRDELKAQLKAGENTSQDENPEITEE